MHGLAGRWTYIARTVPGVGDWLRPLEDAIRLRLIPAILGRAPPGDIEWELLTLPVRLGGMGIPSPTQMAGMRRRRIASSSGRSQSPTPGTIRAM